jgi:hypothetical protein
MATDHTLVQDLIDSGTLAQKQAKGRPLRKLLIYTQLTLSNRQIFSSLADST